MATATGSHEEPPDVLESEESTHTGRLLSMGWVSFSLAAVDAVCVAFVAMNSFSALLGTGAVVMAKWATFLHDSDGIRLPLLGLATVGATITLAVVGNNFRLRHAPSASWRFRPLSAAERRRVMLAIGTSLMTLVMVGAELAEHHHLNGHF